MQSLKRKTQLALLLVLATGLSGCAGSPYLTDRGRDLADVFTATVGVGLGAKARAGPFHAGLFVNSDVAGLRGGTCSEFWRGHLAPLGHVEIEATVFSMQAFELPPGRTQRERGKTFVAQGVPLVALVSEGDGWLDDVSIRPFSYYTQIEVAGGLLGTVRLGVNPGELLDFLLGWTTLDIFDDDLGARQRREETKPAPAAD